MELFVLFGQPGAGKTFVGKIMQNHFGFYLHEGDDDMPEELRTAIEQEIVVDDSMRDVFFQQLISTIQQLQTKHDKLVVTQTFIKDKYRKQFLEAFPHAQFVLIEAQTSIREKRLLQRKEWQLDRKYWRKMAALFETPQIEYSVITNNNEGDDAITRQLKPLL